MQPIVALIPARGGSKRIEGKNLVSLNRKPLIAHTIEQALAAEQVDRVYVSTEDSKIAETARLYGSSVIERPSDLADDSVTSEAVLCHALAWLRSQQIEPKLVVFLQATSPVREPGEIDRAIDLLYTSDADSLFSACRNTRFVWGTRESGEPYPLNYDFRCRRRTQDLDLQYQENGSIYLFKPWVLDTFQNRLGGKIAVHEMDYWSSFEIDTPEDLELCAWILERRAHEQHPKLPERVELVVFDFDGVMTDDRVWVREDGTEAVACSRGDGLGLAMLSRAGIEAVVLSTETNPIVTARCEKLGLHCRQGLVDKAVALRGLVAERGVELSQVVYVGNDVNDLECLRIAGCGVATADAHPSVREAADWVLSGRGGRGAVRELCNTLISAVEPEGGDYGQGR